VLVAAQRARPALLRAATAEPVTAAEQLVAQQSGSSRNASPRDPDRRGRRRARHLAVRAAGVLRAAARHQPAPGAAAHTAAARARPHPPLHVAAAGDRRAHRLRLGQPPQPPRQGRDRFGSGRSPYCRMTGGRSGVTSSVAVVSAAVEATVAAGVLPAGGRACLNVEAGRRIEHYYSAPRRVLRAQTELKQRCVRPGAGLGCTTGSRPVASAWSLEHHRPGRSAVGMTVREETSKGVHRRGRARRRGNRWLWRATSRERVRVAFGNVNGVA